LSRKTNATTLTFEFDKATQRKFRYRQVLPAHDDPTRDAECPMLYLDKASATPRSLKSRSKDCCPMRKTTMVLIWLGLCAPGWAWALVVAIIDGHFDFVK
jgi:hypothetical protein